MFHRPLTALAAGFAALLIPGPAWGQAQARSQLDRHDESRLDVNGATTAEIENATQARIAAEQERQVIRLSQIIGMNVLNQDQTTLGRVSDIVVNDVGQILFVMLEGGARASVGPDATVTTGRSLVAVPFAALQVQPNSRTALLNITSERLQQAPSFSIDQFPTVINREFVGRMNTFFGIDPRLEMETEAPLGPGTDVRDDATNQERRLDRRDADVPGSNRIRPGINRNEADVPGSGANRRNIDRPDRARPDFRPGSNPLRPGVSRPGQDRRTPITSQPDGRTRQPGVGVPGSNNPGTNPGGGTVQPPGGRSSGGSTGGSQGGGSSPGGSSSPGR